LKNSCQAPQGGGKLVFASALVKEGIRIHCIKKSKYCAKINIEENFNYGKSKSY